jgi:demethylmenaquinone methyltransferase/2-methoxy-6-polyprenyl-1,4-benzoquinol methylase
MIKVKKIEKQPMSKSDGGNYSNGRTLKIGGNLDSQDKKRSYNEQLFTEIAPRYDFITRALSFWRDAAWKRDLVAALPSHEKPFCLDLACGTGDITLLLAKKYPQGRIVGLDITEPMLLRALARNTSCNVHFLKQDMSSLSFASESADILTGSYALRNAPDLETTVNGIYKVLKPGGTAAFLDFSKPVSRLAQYAEYWLLKIWGGLWGIFLHNNADVYGYIAESLRRFPDRDKLRDILQERGFTIVTSKRYFFGIIEILVLKRPL